MSFLTATTLILAHGAGITLVAGIRCTVKETDQTDPNADQMSS